jgi:eukaryotic-like serine/threonine-protein kinase
VVTSAGLWNTEATVDEEELEGVPNAGDVVVGKYRVERILGVGGMGCVVAAEHSDLGQTVAIKFLLAKAAKNPKNIERFKREAQAAARIKSDHVARVTDIGTLPNGTPYMVMEHLDGEDLSERLLRGGVAIPEACRYILQACEALAEAHRAGIVHRDLKPANLFLTPHPAGGQRVKVLDFGISKILGPPGAGADLTKTSALMGSPLYMSPEQMMSAKDADARADIWALGVILYEMVTAVPPFIGDTLPEICGKILTAAPTPLDHALPGAPSTLASVVAGALAKKPEERYPTLAEFAMAVAPFAGPEGERSAAVVCRVLDRHPSAASAIPSTAPFGTPDAHAHPAHPHPAGAHPAGAQPAHPQPAGAHPSHAQPAGAATTGGSPPAGSPPTGAVTTGAPGAATVAPATQPSPQAYVTPLPATIPGTSPVHAHAAMATAASTGAPVAQTMSEEPPRRRRGPVIALAAVVLTVIIGATIVGLRRRARRAKGPDAAPVAAAPAVATVGPAATDSPEPSDSAGDDPQGLATAAPSASADARDRRPFKRPRAVDRVKKQLKKAKPGHKAKQGDDLFN